MSTFVITDTVVYEVEAESEEEALEMFTESADPDEFFIAVSNREVYKTGKEANARI